MSSIVLGQQTQENDFSTSYRLHKELLEIAVGLSEEVEFIDITLPRNYLIAFSATIGLVALTTLGIVFYSATPVILVSLPLFFCLNNTMQCMRNEYQINNDVDEYLLDENPFKFDLIKVTNKIAQQTFLWNYFVEQNAQKIVSEGNECLFGDDELSELNSPCPRTPVFLSR